MGLSCVHCFQLLQLIHQIFVDVAGGRAVLCLSDEENIGGPAIDGLSFLVGGRAKISPGGFSSGCRHYGPGMVGFYHQPSGRPSGNCSARRGAVNGRPQTTLGNGGPFLGEEASGRS